MAQRQERVIWLKVFLVFMGCLFAIPLVLLLGSEPVPLVGWLFVAAGASLIASGLAAGRLLMHRIMVLKVELAVLAVLSGLALVVGLFRIGPTPVYLFHVAMMYISLRLLSSLDEMAGQLWQASRQQVDDSVSFANRCAYRPGLPVDRRTAPHDAGEFELLPPLTPSAPLRQAASSSDLTLEEI